MNKGEKSAEVHSFARLWRLDAPLVNRCRPGVFGKIRGFVVRLPRHRANLTTFNYSSLRSSPACPPGPPRTALPRALTATWLRRRAALQDRIGSCISDSRHSCHQSERTTTSPAESPGTRHRLTNGSGLRATSPRPHTRRQWTREPDRKRKSPIKRDPVAGVIRAATG